MPQVFGTLFRLIATLVTFALAAATYGQEGADVLLAIQSSGDGNAAEFRRGFEGLLDPARSGLDIAVETFDTNRSGGPEFDELFMSLLEAKYADSEPELIVAAGPAPLEFFLRYRASLFAESSLVFAGVREESIPAPLPPHTTGVVSEFDIVGTVELALALQPDARQLVVLSGIAPFDQSWDAFARNQLAAYADRFDLTFLAGVPIRELLVQLAGLPRNSIVIYTTMFEDRAGDRFVPTTDLLTRITAASAAPVYGVYESSLGTGVVGGHFDDLSELGRQAGRLVLRALAGETGLPVQHVSGRNRVDARALERWGIDESVLPAGTEIRFREISVWQRYWPQILGVLAFIALQSLAIVALLLRARKRRVEEALQLTQDRYRAVVEAQTDLVCRYLPDSTLTFVNEAYCRAFELPREKLIGSRFIDLLPESERPRVLQHIESLIGSMRSETTTYQVVRGDGSIGWQRWVDQVIVGSNRVIELQGIGRDVTDLKKAESEARESREQVAHLTRVAILGELSGALAHELNQPLTAILSNAQTAEVLLDRAEPDVAEVRAILADIVADDLRAGDVISRLRGMLRKEAVDVDAIDLNAVARDALALARAQLVDLHVDVDTDFAAPLPPVRGDRVQLQQVLLNLIMNGAESMVGNETLDRVLSVSTATRDGVVIATVEDRGPGLTQDIADRVFEPFFTTKSNGLGLGLSICRSIISSHQGRLWAANNGDRGARFMFSLPITDVTAIVEGAVRAS